MPNPNPPGDLTTDPGSISFGNVIEGNTVSATIVLGNDDEGPLALGTITISPSTDYSFTPPVPSGSLLPGATKNLVLVFAPTAGAVRNASITIPWRDSFGQRAPGTVAVTATGVPSNNSSFAPPSLGYGNVQVGQNVQQVVQLQNTGNVDFNVTALTFTTGVNFSLVGAPALPFVIHPGGQQALTVKFAPAIVGTATDTLTATTSVGASPTLALAGVGVAVVPIGICVNNTRRVVAGGYDSSGLQGAPVPLQLSPDDLNSEQAGSIVFNGSSWEALGEEKTMTRLGFYYENLGVASLSITVSAFRPQVGADSFDVKSASIILGTAVADGTERYAEVDLVATGELLELTISRNASSGPVSILAIIPQFQPRGEKVRNT